MPSSLLLAFALTLARAETPAPSATASAKATVDLPAPPRADLLERAVALAHDPTAQQALLQAEMPPSSNAEAFKAVGAAWAVSQALAEAGQTDPEVHRTLLSRALQGDEDARREAVAEARRVARSPGATGPVAHPPEGPLAVPVDGPRPGMTRERLGALRQYKSRALSLRPETVLSGGGTTVMGGFGWGAYPYWWGAPVVVSDPVRLDRTWGLYQGPRRLSVPEFFDVTGQTTLATDLQRDIDRAQTASTVWFSAAGAGGVALLAGVVGMGQAHDFESYATMNSVALAGTVVLVTGLVGGSFPSSKAGRLRRDPSASLRIDEAQGMVDAHNEGLARELGVSPDEVWLMELGAER